MEGFNMRKVLYLVPFLFVASALAETPSPRQPAPNSFVSEGVYSSTNVSVVTSSQAIVISTRACIIHTIVVNYPGASGDQLEVWNSKISTTPSAVKYGDGRELQRVLRLDTSSKKSLLYDVFCDSGMAIYNQGTGEATITYLEK